MNMFSNIVIFIWCFVLVSKTFCNDFPVSNTSLPPPLQNEFPTKCMGDLGCFETGPPFYNPILRPTSLLPFDEDRITTKFSLFTRKNPREPHLIDQNFDSFVNSSFDPYCSTKIIIHGFTIKPETKDAYDTIKNAILSKGSYNVILVDWSDSNQPPYFQAIANGRVVGAQLARLIQALQYYKGANPDSFHIIGHSLGAAVAGWAGERIPRLGRITGLDPAGMYFYLGERPVRLDTSDAEFVDVIITNGGRKYEEGIGTLEPIGHVNFYPNGGNTQPGCYNPRESFKEFDIQRNICSHMRALELFIASIFNDRCRFLGTPCENYELYQSGQCSERFWWRGLRRVRRSFGRFFGHSSYRPYSHSSYRPFSHSSYRPSGDSSYRPSGDSSYRPFSHSSNRPSGDSSYRPSGGSSYRPFGHSPDRSFSLCNNKNNEMGFHAKKSDYPDGQTFFLKTTGASPYCIPSTSPPYRRHWYSVKM